MYQCEEYFSVPSHQAALKELAKLRQELAQLRAEQVIKEQASDHRHHHHQTPGQQQQQLREEEQKAEVLLFITKQVVIHE